MKLLRTLTVFVLAFALLGFAGCSEDEDDDNPVDLGWYNDFEAAALDYMTTYTDANISAQGVFDGFAAGTDMFIIDWRASDAYAAGHIDISTATGTVSIQNWAVADLDANMDQLPTDGTLIINVCYSGQTASQVTGVMKMAGYDNARNMLFGMSGWTGGTPWSTKTDIGWTDLETTSNTWPTETYQNPARDFASETLVEAIFEAFDAYLTDNGGTANIAAADVQTLLTDGDDSNDPFVINYWSTTDYDLGHIPGAYQLTPGADGFSSDVLDLLPTDGTQIVIYCYTGQTSSQMTGMLRTLGYNAYSLLYGMNGINQQHPSNHGFTPPTTSFPTVAE